MYLSVSSTADTNGQFRKKKKIGNGLCEECTLRVFENRVLRDEVTEERRKLYNEELNLLKPTGHVKHQQFNIQQLYVLPTLYLCVLYLSENKQRLVPLTA